MPASLHHLAETLAGGEAADIRARFAARAAAVGLVVTDDAATLALLLEGAFPALAREIHAHPEDVVAIARGGTRGARDLRAYRRLAQASIAEAEAGGAGATAGGDRVDREAAVRRGLRRFATREKLRIAARDLASGTAGADVDVTARELSDLASVCVDVALAEARAWAEERFGAPTTEVGRCAFVVLGMGKLGGRELNAGSDVDLLLVYETDDGAVVKDGAVAEQSLHEHFARVTQRLTHTLEDATEDGFVWRVDLRLRPEGSRGPLVNALAAAERYYETWGRTWERAALVRARPIAGDLALGTRTLDALAPFVWRRNVNPQIADEMAALVLRARTELSTEPERDLKLGPGGIREAEFFVQSLQLIWGGREPSVRSANTLDALRRLRARGLVTDREGREMADAYLALRRLEHRVQFATGLQTHTLPRGALLERIARSLGYAAAMDLEKDTDKTRRRVAARFASLGREARERHQSREGAGDDATARLLYAIDTGDEANVLLHLPARFGGAKGRAVGGAAMSPDLARHLLALARRPDFPLGASSRDRYAGLAYELIAGIEGAADPEQAARLLATFFARLPVPSVYASALAEDPSSALRLVGLFGASAFLGEAIVGHPELADRLLFGRGAPSPETARRAIDEEIAALPADADPDDFVGALRRAKGRVTMEVGLADLAGEIGTRDATLVLSELADATLDHAVAFVLREKKIDPPRGLALVAMGKLGGREIGYGSDLDLFFVYEPDGPDDDGAERFIRAAQRVLRVVSTPHGDGPGYELDTRLRPSGNQGLLVVSLEAFARYHAAPGDSEAPTSSPAPRAHDWERQALLKARVAAGDRALGAKVIAIAEAAAYERGAPPAAQMHHLRMRMERELAGERAAPPGHGVRARYDLKLGRGGLVDVEFAVQWLQMKHGGDARVRTTETEAALAALESRGLVDAALATTLLEGYRWLRRLEQRLRVLHGTSVQLIEEGAPGLALLARRMGLRDGPRGSAEGALVERYRAVTRDVRAAYLSVLDVAE